MTPQACEPGDKILTGRGCDGCNPHTRELGAFALELLRVIDVKQSRGEVLLDVTGKMLRSCFMDCLDSSFSYPEYLASGKDCRSVA